MADEQTATQTATPPETATVTHVTDEALSAAFDAAQQTGQTETTETTKTTEGQTGEQTETGESEQTGEHQGEQTETGEHEEPTDNAERSRLGRRLKTIEEKFDAMLSRLEQQVAQPQQQQAQAPVNVTYDDGFVTQQIEAAVERGELPGTIMTPNDQYRVNQFVNGLQQYMGNQYTVGYLNTLKAPTLKGNTPDDIHAEVLAELQNVESPFNLRRYNNPQVDAQTNYLEAKVAILTKRLTGTKPTGVFKGKPAGAPATGTSVSTRTATPNADELPSLDAASLDFIKRSGMSQESVKNALKGNMPFGLMGR